MNIQSFKKLLFDGIKFVSAQSFVRKFVIGILCVMTSFLADKGAKEYTAGNYQEFINCYKKALKIINAAIELQSINKIKDSNIYLQRAFFQYLLKNYELVLEDCNKAIEINPQNSAAYYHKAIACIDLEDYENAFASFDKAIELNPKDFKVPADREWYELKIFQVYANRAWYKLKIFKDIEAALEDCNIAIQLAPKDSYAYFVKAFAYKERASTNGNKEDYESALFNFDKSIELNPTSISAYSLRGYVKKALGKYEEALEDCNIAIQLEPRDFYAYFVKACLYKEKANIYGNTEDYEAALFNFDKSIELNPESNSYVLRGNLKCAMGRLEEAISDYSKAIEVNPKDSDAYFQRALAKGHLTSSAFENLHGSSVFDDCNKAIEMDSQNVNVYSLRACIKHDLENHLEAIADCDKCLELNPEYSYAYFLKGSAYKALGRPAEALENYNKALELEPNYAYSYLERSKVKVLLENLEAALEDLKKAKEIFLQQEDFEGQEEAEEEIKKLKDL